MNPRILALRLASLAPTEQRRMLEALPSSNRTQMQQLIADVSPKLAAGQISFADFADIAPVDHVAATPQKTPREPNFSAAILEFALKNEEVSVQHQVMEILRAPAGSTLVTASVYSALVTFVDDKSRDLPIHRNDAVVRRTWWRRLWI